MQEIDIETAIKISFKYMDKTKKGNLRKYELLVDDKCFQGINYKRKYEFLLSLKESILKSGLKFEQIFSSIIWEFDCLRDIEITSFLLEEWSKKQKELLLNNNPFALLYKIDDEGDICFE